MSNNDKKSTKVIVDEIRRADAFKDSSEEELNNIAESLNGFSTILFELYSNHKFRENEQREPNQRHP